jgi:hypothetical protein
VLCFNLAHFALNLGDILCNYFLKLVLDKRHLFFCGLLLLCLLENALCFSGLELFRFVGLSRVQGKVHVWVLVAVVFLQVKGIDEEFAALVALEVVLFFVGRHLD